MGVHIRSNQTQNYLFCGSNLVEEWSLSCLFVRLILYKNNLDLPFSSPKCTALSDCLYPNNNMELNYVIVWSTLGLHQLSVQNWVG